MQDIITSGHAIQAGQAIQASQSSVGVERVADSGKTYRLEWLYRRDKAYEFRDGVPTGNYFEMTTAQRLMIPALLAALRVPVVRRAARWAWSRVRVHHHFDPSNPPDVGVDGAVLTPD